MISRCSPMLVLLSCLSPFGGVNAQADNTPFAGKGKVIPLFDGRTLQGWTLPNGKPITRGWEVVDGMLHRKGRGGQIVTAKEYEGDFELHFEWKIAPGGNSGVKYRVRTYGRRPLGMEYQLLDDKRNNNARSSTRSCGALYGLYAPSKDKPLKPAGEFNTSKIVVRGNHVEHWLNGKKILEAELGSKDWEKRIARSKFRRAKGFGVNPRGKFLIQDHGSEVWFRKMTLHLPKK